MPTKIILTSYLCWLMYFQCIAQTSQLIVSISPDANLKSILDQICSRDQYLIAYPQELAKLKPAYFGELEAASIEHLFTALFPGQLQVVSLSPTRHLLRSNEASIPQYTNRISGKIEDEEGRPLSDILVHTSNGHSTFSDSTGSFSLNLNEIDSTKIITFRGIGFETTAKSQQQLIEDPRVVLSSVPIIFQPITVESRVPTVRIENTNQSTVVRTNPTGQFNSALNALDLIKKVQLLPGVSADDDLSSEIKIRGSSGNESLIALDGIPLYRVDHFYGIYGAINGDYVKKSRLYKNALPIEYGGKTGGMLDLASEQHITRTSTSIDIDFLTSSIKFSSPISSRWSFQLAGRSTYKNASELPFFDLAYPNREYYLAEAAPVNSNIILPTAPRFDFYDVNSKIRFTPNQKWTIEGNFYKSTDQLDNNFDLSFQSRINRIMVTNTQIFRNSESWNHLGSSLRLDGKIGELLLKSNTYFTQYNRDASLSSLFNINRLQESLSVSLQNSQQNQIMTLGTTTYILRKTKTSIFKSGIDYKYHQSRYLFSEDEVSLISGNDVAYEISGFGEKTWRQNGFSTTIGSRVTFYSADNGWYLDPKIQFSYALDGQNTFKASAHFAHQYTREINYETRLGQSTDYLLLANGVQFPVGSSLQFMIGHTFKKNSWLIDFELYHKNLNGALEYGLQRPGFESDFSSVKNRSYQIFTGRGKVYGLDLLLSKEWKHGETQISYTLSKSLRQFKEIRRNLPFPAQDDRRHQLKWTGTYRMARFTLSGNFIFSSGKPYFAINELSGQSNRNELPGTAIRNLPSYQRIDIGLDYSLNIFGKKGTIGLSCFNLTNHQNVKYLQYIFSIPTDSQNGVPLRTIVGAETTLLGRTPNVRFRIEF